jgi:hypothetical protein
VVAVHSNRTQHVTAVYDILKLLSKFCLKMRTMRPSRLAIGVRREVSKGVENGRRSSALRAVRPFQGWPARRA